jgi:hypothetical protein
MGPPVVPFVNAGIQSCPQACARSAMWEQSTRIKSQVCVLHLLFTAMQHTQHPKSLSTQCAFVPQPHYPTHYPNTPTALPDQTPLLISRRYPACAQEPGKCPDCTFCSPRVPAARSSGLPRNRGRPAFPSSPKWTSSSLARLPRDEKRVDFRTKPISHKPAHLRKISDQKLARHWEFAKLT